MAGVVYASWPRRATIAGIELPTMFQLQQLTNSKHVTGLIKVMLVLVIVSFIFFYGWNTSSSRRQAAESSYARLRSEGFHPFNQWDYLNAEDIKRGKQEQIQGKLRGGGQGLASYLQQKGNIIDRLVSQQEAARQAAN